MQEHLCATDNGVSRSPYSKAGFPNPGYLFQGHAHGWFSPAGLPQETLNLLISIPCRSMYRLLVPVIAFDKPCGRNRARTYDLCDVNAVL